VVVVVEDVVVEVAGTPTTVVVEDVVVDTAVVGVVGDAPITEVIHSTKDVTREKTLKLAPQAVAEPKEVTPASFLAPPT